MIVKQSKEYQNLNQMGEGELEDPNSDGWIMGGSPGELNEELVTQEKRKKGLRTNCDVGEATEGLENELCRR